MNEIFPNIYEVLPSKVTPKKYRSFFVKREEGNLLIPCFSTNSTIETHFDQIESLGGLSSQLLGDSHFKSDHCDVVAERFGAPLYCSEGEAPDVLAKLKQVVVFPFERHLLDTNLEVIPTPGHRDGGVCYRVTVQAKRYLFVGDFVWHDGHSWIPTARKATTQAYISSLHVLAELEFDVLLANSQLFNPVYAVELNDQAPGRFFEGLLKQIDAS